MQNFFVAAQHPTVSTSCQILTSHFFKTGKEERTTTAEPENSASLPNDPSYEDDNAEVIIDYLQNGPLIENDLDKIEKINI